MTKKDYELIASVLRGCGNNYKNLTAMTMLREVTYQLAYFLGKENPRFDRKKFLIATGWE